MSRRPSRARSGKTLRLRANFYTGFGCAGPMATRPRQEPPPIASGVANFYEKAPRYDFESSLARRHEELRRHGATALLLEELLRAFPPGKIAAALEVGGEYATTLSVLRQRFEIGSATSCDLVLPSHQADGIRYVAAPAESLAAVFPPASFDLVLMIDVIEHLYDPDLVMEQVRQVLTPSGVLAIVTPNLASWLNRLLLLGGFMPLDMEVSTREIFGRPSPKGAPPAGHIRVFTLRALHEFLRFHGFRVRGSRTAPLGFSHPTYIRPSGEPTPAPSSSVGPPGLLDSPRGGRLLRSMLALDRMVARAAPGMGSRIVAVASAGGRRPTDGPTG